MSPSHDNKWLLQGNIKGGVSTHTRTRTHARTIFGRTNLTHSLLLTCVNINVITIVSLSSCCCFTACQWHCMNMTLPHETSSTTSIMHSYLTAFYLPPSTAPRHYTKSLHSLAYLLRPPSILKKNCERRGFQIKDNWKKYAERCLENMDPFHILKVMQSPCLCLRVEHSRKVQLPGFYKTWWKSASFCGSWAWTFSRSSHSWSAILIGRLFILPVYSSPVSRATWRPHVLRLHVLAVNVGRFLSMADFVSLNGF